MSNRFTETDTERYYDAEDAIYRSFWDQEGSLHWGYFDEGTGTDFLNACANLNNIMADRAAINRDSRVLDMGCGNGNTALWLNQSRGCRITGVDLSGVRIANAQEALKRLPAEARDGVEFEKASVTSLPYDEGTFTHVWSQATIYHVHQKEEALREACRVLNPGGVFIFDDLIKPRADISQEARTHVYDRLLFDTPFSFDSYRQALTEAGFQVGEAQDLSQHLKTSYQCLGRMARERSEGTGDKFEVLAQAYDQMVKAIDNAELGWAMYICRK